MKKTDIIVDKHRSWHNRKNWLFAGSQRAGQRAAAVMSLIQSAKMNGHDPYAYLKDVLARLPTHPNSRIKEFLPHLWRPETAKSTHLNKATNVAAETHNKH